MKPFLYFIIHDDDDDDVFQNLMNCLFCQHLYVPIVTGAAAHQLL
jgi:hypothetical protein